jgi:uncharacterized protein YjiS (DUF1127 family)
MSANGSGPASAATEGEAGGFDRLGGLIDPKHSAARQSFQTTRAHRPLRRLSDDQLDDLGQSVRDEKKLRREDAGRFQEDSRRDLDRAGFGKRYMLDVARRYYAREGKL